MNASQQKEVAVGSDLHAKLVRELQTRYQYSRQYVSRRYDKWRRADERFMMYRVESTKDKQARDDRTKGKVKYVTLEVPYSYAMLMSAHTYWTSVFLGRNPVFQYAGRHAESEMSTGAVEALIEYQCNIGRMMPNLYSWILDAGKYGIGVVGNYWEEEVVNVSRIVEKPETIFGLALPGGKMKQMRETAEIKSYCGNKLHNVRPYDFFPDPRVPLVDFQKGEFCGRLVTVGWNEILRRKAQGYYFNTEALSAMPDGATSWYEQRDTGTSQIDLPAGIRNDGVGYMTSALGKGFFHLLEMTVELVPSEWGLGSNTKPEKWFFTLANGVTLIGAQPSGLLHNKFPFAVLQYEVEAYAMQSRGMLEIVNDLQDIMTWLFNTHMFNVRKIVNGRMLVDPSRVTMSDLEADIAAPIIRAKPAAYGTDLRTAISQLEANDVTQNHMRDANTVADMMQRVTGVTENIMGMLNQGGRKTATEVRTSSTFGVNRMKTNAEYMSATGFADLSIMLVQNSQQLYDGDLMLRIAGATSMRKSDRVKVTPDMIAGFFDFVPVDGTMPVDRYAQAALLKEGIAGAAQIQEVAQKYDIAKLFGYSLELAGIKNIDQFERIVVSPDAQLQQRAAAGNVVPIGVGNEQGTSGPGVGGGEGGIQPSIGPPIRKGSPEGAPQIGGVGAIG